MILLVVIREARCSSGWQPKNYGTESKLFYENWINIQNN